MEEIVRCYVCDNVVKNEMEDGFLQVTRYSGTPVCKFLEKFVGHVLVSRSPRDIWCPSCLDKIDCYDQAIVTAKQVESELLELFATTVNNYAGPDITKSSVILSTVNKSVEKHHEYNENTVNEVLQGNLEEQSGTSDIHDEEDVLSITQLKKEKKVGRPRKRNKNVETHLERNSEDSICDRLDKQKLPTRQQVHSKKSTAKSEIDYYKCDRCNLKFEEKSDYKLHMKSHDGIDKQVCDICGQTYKSKTALDIHVGLHKGE